MNYDKYQVEESIWNIDKIKKNIKKYKKDIESMNIKINILSLQKICIDEINELKIKKIDLITELNDLLIEYQKISDNLLIKALNSVSFKT